MASLQKGVGPERGGFLRSDTPVFDVCRHMGMSDASFYVWKKKYGKLGLTESRELRQPRNEDARLRRLVADVILDKRMVGEIIRGKP